MRNRALRELNFEELIKYVGGAPRPAKSYRKAPTCTGFCVSCDKLDGASPSAARLDQISHAADTHDYETILGPIPTKTRSAGGWVEEPIMFLLESPGSSFHNGKPLTIRGHSRTVPVYHYYWAPPAKGWPDGTGDLSNPYGPYFAYLMARFGLKNVYITNAVKCGKTRRSGAFEAYSFRVRRPSRDTTILRNCASEFLGREIDLHRPAVIFAFGGSAAKALRVSEVDTRGAEVVSLIHPAARRSREAIVKENNTRFSRGLKEGGIHAAV